MLRDPLPNRRAAITGVLPRRELRRAVEELFHDRGRREVRGQNWLPLSSGTPNNVVCIATFTDECIDVAIAAPDAPSMPAQQPRLKAAPSFCRRSEASNHERPDAFPIEADGP